MRCYLIQIAYNIVNVVKTDEIVRTNGAPLSVHFTRRGDYKLIQYYEYDDYQLFNIREDISENNDLAEKMPAKGKQLLAELMAWVKDTNAPVPTKPNPKFTPWRGSCDCRDGQCVRRRGGRRLRC